jgi:hypothetical protein
MGECRRPAELARIVQNCAVRDRLPWRIEEVRKALIFRSRELFEASPNYDGETEAIETALYALQALEKGLGSNTKDRRHAPRAG